MGEEVCRVCLSYDFEMEHGKGLSLFEEYNDCVISDRINALTNVDIKEGDGLPDRICPNCLLDLESAYKFKQKCENTNTILLSTLNNAPKIESDDVDLPMKEEYVDNDSDFDYVEENIRLAYQAASADVKPDVEAPPKPSRAIDLKLECHDCGGAFKSKCKLSVHWKKIHMTEKLKCPICQKKFKTFAALKSHKKRNLKTCANATKVRIEGEGRNRIFHCKDCDYKAKRLPQVLVHMVIHTGERPFQCDICHRSYTTLSSLSAHKEGTHKTNKTETTCHYCGKHIQGRSKLYKHMKKHRQDRYPCKTCNSVLKNKSSLQNHMKRHSGIKSYACEVCPTTFYTASELYNHKNYVHLKSKFYTCEKCDYKSLQYSPMAKHKWKHSESNVACDVCGTFLDNEQQLALHKKRHTEKHHKCSHCDKSYYSRKSLCTHMRNIHKISIGSRCGPTLKVDSVKGESSEKSLPCK